MKANKQKKTSTLYQIFGMAILCVVVIIFIISSTSAWFRDSSVTSNGEPNIKLIGTLDVEVTTDFNFYNLALAPDTVYLYDKRGASDNYKIGTYIRTTPENDIDGAYVRVKFEPSIKLSGTNTWVDYVGNGAFDNDNDLIDLYFRDGMITTQNTTYSSSTHGGKWYYHTDGYYYYIGAVYSVGAYSYYNNNSVSVSGIEFNQGYKTNNTMVNTMASADVKFVFTVDAIQRQYGAYSALWTTAPLVFTSFASSDTSTHP